MRQIILKPADRAISGKFWILEWRAYLISLKIVVGLKLRDEISNSLAEPLRFSTMYLSMNCELCGNRGQHWR